MKKYSPQGDKFDPNLHQAMFELETADVPPGHVVQVIQAGYMIGDRVLRPAMVVVGKGGDEEPGTRNQEPEGETKEEPSP